jgi:anti-sigma factor RsiW
MFPAATAYDKVEDMMQEERPQPNDDANRQLWQRYTEATSSPSPPATDHIDPIALAAYLDGTADPNEIADIERRLSVDDKQLRAVIELRETCQAVQADANTAVPASVTSAAKTLARDPHAVAPHETTPRPMRIWHTRLRWAAAAVFVLLTGSLGYQAGAATYQADESSRAGRDGMAQSFDTLLDETPVTLIAVIGGGA